MPRASVRPAPRRADKSPTASPTATSALARDHPLAIVQSKQPGGKVSFLGAFGGHGQTLYDLPGPVRVLPGLGRLALSTR